MRNLPMAHTLLRLHRSATPTWLQLLSCRPCQYHRPSPIRWSWQSVFCITDSCYSCWITSNSFWETTKNPLPRQSLLRSLQLLQM